MTARDTAPDAFHVPPHSIEAEQSVLGALLLDNSAIDMLGALRAEHFYRHDHRTIFDAATAIILAGERADVVTVNEHLTVRGQAEAAGGLAYINSLAQNTPGAANVARYAQIVVDRARLRGLLRASDEIAELVHMRNGREVDDLLSDAQARLESLNELGSEGPRLMRDDLAELLQELDDQYQGQALPVAVATGFADLDAQLDGGLRDGELVIVAARPSMGKSAIAMQIAEHVAEKVGPVLAFSLEMPGKQLTARSVARRARLPLGKTKNGAQLTEDDWSAITDATKAITELPLHVDDSSSVSVADIARRSRAVKRQHGLRLLVIDYLGLVRLGREERHDLQIGAVTRGLKVLAKQLDVPVLLLTQLNRELEKRPNKRPQISDLRDSGSIEQDADIVLFLYRDEVYRPDTADRGIAELIVAKQRNGALGKVGLAFFSDQVRFADLATGRLFGDHQPRSTTRGFEG